MRLQQYTECVLMALIAVASIIGCGMCASETTDPPARGLALSLSTQGFVSNCRTSNDGAGITTNTIALIHTGDGCAPVTFVRMRGIATLGTYQSNCSSPPIASCIETDETFTVADIEPGTYTVQVRGRHNGVECWFNDDTFAVPSRGQLIRRLILTPKPIPGCPVPPGAPMPFSGIQ